MLTSGISGGGSLFTSNSGMIKKMYFPKEILAISSAFSAAIVMIVGYVFVILLVVVTGYPINPVACLFIPFIMILAVLFYMGCGLLLGSVAVYVRDIQYVLGSMSIVFFICTPIRTTMANATGLISTIYSLNPLTYFIEPMHQIIYGASVPDPMMLIMAALVSIIVFVAGYAVFLKLKRGFVERL